MTSTLAEVNFRQLLGIALLVLSTLTWLAVPVIVLLGPELMGQSRRRWQRFRTAARSAVDPDH